MINLATETVVTLTHAPAHLPRRRGGKKPHVSTMYRWAKLGLETIQVGGTKCTSVEALQRFCERLSAREEPGGIPSRCTGKSIRAAKGDVGKRLDDIGI